MSRNKDENNAASERFNDEASKWDQRPTIISVTEAASTTMMKMTWYTSTKTGKSNRMRAMDFGCGTGFLTYKILDPEVFQELVGVDVAEGMINAFNQKIRLDISSHRSRCKLSAVCSDLSQIDLTKLNSMVGHSQEYCQGIKDKGYDEPGFDVIYTLLAFHHIKDPESMMNDVIKDKYLNNGGRIIVMDYEHDDTKQIFHPEHIRIGDHYEHDGFSIDQVQEWFVNGNNRSTTKWDLDTLEISKVPFLAPVDPDEYDLVPKRIEETYNIIIATCCTSA